ncbi:diguanylate cyclase [Sulfurimonas hongkongensis]|uniref:diguanylate cyclase n=1 Tax=Sulfurimonas hongkongensis TaxID=1172190 RepID=T0JP23_9BACT|nr:GGDEF domain-containing protein [Sulfurimonas hongkongensis]EQB39881.1 diguanylate cyclase [Sulfurimonas hongkongensis]
MTVGTIIKKAIKRLDLEGKLLTPDFYADAFCKEAQKAGVQYEDCNHVTKFTKTLNPEFQKELTQYRITTIAELARFLISRLNRTKPTICTELLDAQNTLIRRILQVVEVLHNAEASALAKEGIKLLNSNPSAMEYELYRQHWINFITTYDDSFLEKLKLFASVDRTNLKKTVQSIDLSKLHSQKDSQEKELKRVVSLLASSFVPSIASSVNEKIADLSKRLNDNPALIENSSIEDEIKSIIMLRIALDKNSVKEMIKSIDGVLDKLSLRLIEMIERSDDSTLEIQKIKKELESYNEDAGTSFSLAHKKLFIIATALEENTQILSKDLKNQNGEIKILSEKINKLELELQEAKNASKEDFLTKLFNKRALDEFLKIKEGEFERYGHNFSIVMFDLDHFKDVNDNFGHEAGDAILSAFAKILKKEARSVDIVGRFGGEEFIALLSETDTAGGVVFAQKIRKHVQDARFMYRGKRIEITVSAGVSERVKHTSLQNLINSADEYLYQAKKEGRNRVAYKK